MFKDLKEILGSNITWNINVKFLEDGTASVLTTPDIKSETPLAGIRVTGTAEELDQAYTAILKQKIKEVSTTAVELDSLVKSLNKAKEDTKNKASGDKTKKKKEDPKTKNVSAITFDG